MSNEKKYIKMYACCIPVKGAARSALCDVQRNEYRLIPNALYDLLPFFDQLNKDELVLYYGDSNKETIAEYIDFLVDNEYAFFA